MSQPGTWKAGLFECFSPIDLCKFRSLTIHQNWTDFNLQIPSQNRRLHGILVPLHRLRQKQTPQWRRDGSPRLHRLRMSFSSLSLFFFPVVLTKCQFSAGDGPDWPCAAIPSKVSSKWAPVNPYGVNMVSIATAATTVWSRVSADAAPWFRRIRRRRVRSGMFISQDSFWPRLPFLEHESKRTFPTNSIPRPLMQQGYSAPNGGQGMSYAPPPGQQMGVQQQQVMGKN